MAPKVTVWDNETAEIRSVTQRPFVVDVQQEKAGSKPVVQTFDEGTTILARPRLQQSSDIQLDLRLRYNQIEEVNVYEKSSQQSVQAPVVTTMQVELSATLKPRETPTLWIADPTTPEENSPPTALSKLLRKKNSGENPKSTLMLLITPSVVSEEVVTTPRTH